LNAHNDFEVTLPEGHTVGWKIDNTKHDLGLYDAMREAEALRIAQLFNISIEEARKCR
jgi:hypothetical protein